MTQIKVKNYFSHNQHGLKGEFSIPGDKSISHRAVILSALSEGESEITGLLEGEDVLATIEAFRQCGVLIEQYHDALIPNKRVWRIDGVGLGALKTPETTLDMGNSGTAMRLMMGVIAGHDMAAELGGDASLNKRPMARVAMPLREMGANIAMRDDNYPPLHIQGKALLQPIDYQMEVPSAQVKSAIMLAALNAKGTSRIIEPILTRDHSERMMAGRGADVNITTDEIGRRAIDITGGQALKAMNLAIPSDPSSAAFAMVAATLIPDSSVQLRNIGLNETRTGLIKALKMMGAKIDIVHEKDIGGERVGDINIAYAPLKGIELTGDIAPSMIDEYPILAVAAAFAEGESVFYGLNELRVKESDRLQVVYDMLRANHIDCEMGIEKGDSFLKIQGVGGNKAGYDKTGGGLVKTHLDHRIAMSGVIFGLTAAHPITIDDARPINTSFPNFLNDFKTINAPIF